MSASFEPVFQRLRAALKKHASKLSVSHDTAEHYGLEASVGPATVKAWGGKAKGAKMPVAWVEVKKNYVSYHLMGIYMNPKLEAELSESLRGHMHGKSCFNFKEVDDALFKELDGVTTESLNALKKGEFIVVPVA
jgi:hypothetical protein